MPEEVRLWQLQKWTGATNAALAKALGVPVSIVVRGKKAFVPLGTDRWVKILRRLGMSAETDGIPSAVQIKAARATLHLTCEEASLFLCSSSWSWQNWEHGKHTMSANLWDLWCLRVGRHTEYMLVKRRSQKEKAAVIPPFNP